MRAFGYELNSSFSFLLDKFPDGESLEELMHVSFWPKTGCETNKFLIPFGQICKWRKLREIHASFGRKTGFELNSSFSFLLDKFPDGESGREFHGTVAGNCETTQ